MYNPEKWQHCEHMTQYTRRKTKQNKTHSIIGVGHNYTQTNINDVNKT
jgi:hypothetical protein